MVKAITQKVTFKIFEILVYRTHSIQNDDVDQTMLTECKRRINNEIMSLVSAVVVSDQRMVQAAVVTQYSRFSWGIKMLAILLITSICTG